MILGWIKLLPPIPKGEILCCSYWDKDESGESKCFHIITSRKARDLYKLYAVNGIKLTKIATAPNPVILEETYLKGVHSYA